VLIGLHEPLQQLVHAREADLIKMSAFTVLAAGGAGN
jgi:hypothetical protein